MKTQETVLWWRKTEKTGKQKRQLDRVPGVQEDFHFTSQKQNTICLFSFCVLSFALFSSKPTSRKKEKEIKMMIVAFYFFCS